MGTAGELAERQRAEALHDGQAQVLAMVATDAPLGAILARLVLLIESQAEGMLGSILHLDEDGRHMRHGAAPSLPEGYLRAIDGESIGPRAGSCGTAMYRGEPVVVSDILTDPLWADYPDLVKLASSHGLRACWSTPILSPQGKVLGSFAMYYREVRSPGPEETRLAGLAAHIAAIAIDRRRAEEALRASEETHRSMVENAPYGILRCTPEGRCLAGNPALVDLLGRASREELLHLDLAADVFQDPEEGRRVLSSVSQAGYRTFETTWKRRDGRPISVVLQVRPVRGPGGELRCLEATVQDITRQRALEAQLHQAQKMEAIGRLAGGVAHDFNNLLTVISSCSELVLETLEPGDVRRGDLLEIRKASDQATGLTRQLLAFSRKQVLRPKVTDLNALLVEMEGLLRRVISENVSVVTELGPGLGRVWADPGQLQQVVLNLVANARDAMPGGGTLTLRTANVGHEALEADERSVMAPGEYVLLAVSDTGTGMSDETMARVFEPFFTTKETGKGTGLGLASVYGVVSQSGGYVRVRSAPGRGATFQVYLPKDERPLAPTVDRAAAAVSGGHETVLLVEDAEAVRAVARVILQRAGYSILEASTGAEALGEARRQAGPIHLLLTDVVMPAMSGPALAGQLRKLHPEARVLFVSGYAGETLALGIEAPWAAYLAKPFTPEMLSQKVREVLDRPEPGAAAGAGP